MTGGAVARFAMLALLAMADPSVASAARESGSVVTVQPVTPDAAPRPDAVWHEVMKSFVPCVLQSLDVQDSCGPELAAAIPGAVDVDRAILRLSAYLDTGRSFDVLTALAESLPEHEVVPHIQRLLRAEDRSRRVTGFFLARDGRRDVRLLESLIELCGQEHDNRSFTQALARQSEGQEHNSALRALMWRSLEDPELRSFGVDMSRRIARPHDFPRLSRVFIENSEYMPGGYLTVLQKLGGNYFSTFLRTALGQPLTPGWKVTCANALVDLHLPDSEALAWQYSEVLTTLDMDVHEALPYATAGRLLGVLWNAPEARPSAMSDRRLAYWERAAGLFESRPDILYPIAYQLFEAYGPDGVGQLDNALEWLTTAIRLDPNPTARRHSDVSDLERRIEDRNLQSRLSIEDLAQLQIGVGPRGWQGRLRSVGKVKRLVRAVPVSLIDYFGPDGLLMTVAASWSLAEPATEAAGDLTFTVAPTEDMPEGTMGARVRLLYIRNSEEGFQGVVESAVVPVEP